MGKSLWTGLWIAVLLTTLIACNGEEPQQHLPDEARIALQVESDAFEAEGTIPQRYTCDGDDISPSLSWSEPPVGTQSLALICDDPDAPGRTWDHWVLFDIPAETHSLPEAIPADPVIEGVGVHGSNSWRRLGYGGPCPPQGAAHRYYFTLYALDTILDLDAGASRKDVEKAMQDHILAEGQLMGRYGR